MAFLILLIVATAILLACLLVAVTRLMLADLRLAWLHSGPTQSTAVERRADGPHAVAAAEPAAVSHEILDDADAEQAVREHLYGRRGRAR